MNSIEGSPVVVKILKELTKEFVGPEYFGKPCRYCGYPRPNARGLRNIPEGGGTNLCWRLHLGECGDVGIPTLTWEETQELMRIIGDKNE